MVDFLSIALGAVVGAVAAGVGTYWATRGSAKTRAGSTGTAVAMSGLPEISPTGEPAPLIPEPEASKARREVKTLLLERELLSGAIARFFELEAHGKITREEREQLIAKYRDQLQVVNAKLGDVEAVIEVSELESLHRELVSLFEQKIGVIENRLNSARAKLEQLHGPLPTIAPEEPPKPEKKPERKKPATDESEADKRVKAIREEVLEALARLEQMDLETA